MSDQLSKVDPNLAHVLQGLHDVLYSGDWSLPADTQQQLEGIYEDGKNRIESAAAPVEVGEYTHAQRESLIAAMRRDAEEYCLFGLDYLSSAAYDYATLARQLAEAREVHETFASDAARRLNEMESALAAATRRVAEVEEVLRQIDAYHGPIRTPIHTITKLRGMARAALNDKARATGEERTPPGSCPCGLTTCDEPWEPGCGLGTVAEFAKVKPE